MTAGMIATPGVAPERYVFPTSFAQQRLWFLEQLDGAGPVWNTRLPVRLKGALDIHALQGALNDVVARHESLRTTFDLRAGEVMQFVSSEVRIAVEHVQPGELADLARQTFDLREGPLLRVFLAKLAADEHLLLILSHHIVSDAWSSGVLFRDLAASYDARHQGRLPRLPELAVQYADFAVWQREWLAGAELRRQAAFWRNHLGGAPALLDLPADRPRPRLQTYRGHRLGRGLPASLSARLQKIATQENATLFMLLFAAFNVLLSRWSGQQDLVVGTPIAGRRRTELEGLVGFFANTLALRTRLTDAPDFRDLLRQVRSTALNAFEHQDLPFEKLVEVLNPVRSLAHSPIFQVLFVLQNSPWEAGHFGDLEVSPAELEPSATARFDLTLSVSDYAGQLWLGLEYSTDLFDSDTIARLAAGFETLLTAVAADPGAAIAELPAESPADVKRQLKDWQPSPTPLPADTGIYTLFANQVAQTPAAIAVECNGSRLSYAALEKRVAEIAWQLKGAGSNATGPVALCLPRSTDMLAAILAVLRAGGWYLPLDPALPPARLQFMLRDSGAQLLLTRNSQPGDFAGFEGTVLDLAAAGGASESGSAPDCGNPPAETPATACVDGAELRPAYLIYTSGSTGVPKGVVVPQRGVVNFLQSMAGVPGLHPADRLLAVTTLSFDIAVLELLLPLTVGATVVIATDTETTDPVVLAGMIDTSRITVMQATPSAWRNLLGAGWTGRPGLRLLCGGEALDRPLAEQLLDCGAEVWNLYGPTETTIWSCVLRIDAEALNGNTNPPGIGRPIANTRCYILDAQGRPVPIGARGELWIAGAGVARGYHGQPALTEARFRPDPFVAPGEPDRQMYQTGDRARWRGDGCLELLGRTDQQLKLRGYRIEPGEIEAALMVQPAIRAAAVVLRVVSGDPRLVAYLVSGQPVSAFRPLSESALAEALRAVLPAWMIPSHFIWLPELPLTPNGKLDRSALPPVSSEISIAPSSAMTAHQHALANLYGEILGRPVGLDDDFFACGGHSLLATRLLARIRADFGVVLPLRTLFESSTVLALSEALTAAGPAAPAEVAVPRVAPGATPSDGRGQNPEAPVRAPLSLVQQRLWFLDRLQPQNSVYHLAWAFHLRGPLNRAVLKTALDELVKRHSALRTCFPEHDGVPEQCVLPHAEWPLQTLKSDPAAVPQLLADAATAPFKLATGPLIRALLVESGAAEFTLLLVVHHIVADGWSLGVLSRELATLYAAGRRDPPAVSVTSLPPLVHTYADYAREQRRNLADGELQRQLAWWQSTLRDMPPFIELPTDRPRPVSSSNRGARLTRVLPVERQAGLHDLAAAEACTFFMVVLAAMNVLLARYAGTEDVVVGTPVAGRPDHELEGMVGFFVNTLVLRTVLSGNPSVRELLLRVRHTTLGAYENADLPFELLVEALQPPRSTNRTPLFQVLFNLHNEPAVPLELDGLEVQAVSVPRNTAKFDLGISLAETAAGLSITVEYNSDLFLPASIERFITDYDVVLSGFIATPDAPLNALPFSAGEHMSWAAEVASPAVGATLPAALAETVARYPQALAVSAPASSGTAGLQPAIDWTYAELAQQVARIAAGLKDRGVQAGDRVALWFGHGAGQIAALLGVLELGAVYVPLDPLAPAERLARIISDAGAGVVLTDRWAPEWPASLCAEQLMVIACETLPSEASMRPFTSAAVNPDSLAYLLYTSGSTGIPKGVPQTHRNVLQHVRTWASKLGLTVTDRLSLLSTCGYDAAVQDIFGTLLTGASVCPLDIRRLDRETLLDRIADRRLTVLHCTPSAYRYLFGGHVACRQDLSGVRLIVLGGEPARRADFELYCARFGKTARFVNGYGMTEATAVTQWFAGRQTRPYGLHLPIGRPVGGEAAVRLLDEHGEPAAFVGELVLDASAVTPGYWSAAGKLSGEGDRRWFHTGDIARLLPDGNLVFVGRRDERLKIGGIRIEPAEVEAALCSHPAVAEAVVMARLSEAGDLVLVACFARRSGALTPSPSPAELRAHLASLLPGAMIPAQFHSCAALPRLPNGKVDRTTLLAGLPDNPAADATAAEAGVAMQSGVHDEQAVLRDIWQKLLRQNNIGLDDNFFALGGHSLLATRLVARIRDRLGIELPLIRLFEAPTIRSLAGIIAASPGLLPQAPGIRNARASD